MINAKWVWFQVKDETKKAESISFVLLVSAILQLVGPSHDPTSSTKVLPCDRAEGLPVSWRTACRRRRQSGETDIQAQMVRGGGGDH